METFSFQGFSQKKVSPDLDWWPKLDDATVHFNGIKQCYFK